tara:strand:+ start:3646 stop:4257 length:612 start_codon:yes stop_codon:yes gene_type:complete
MITPLIETIKVGDHYVYTTEVEYVKNLDSKVLHDELWSKDFLGVNYDEHGNLEDQGPGVHVTLDPNDLPHFFEDAYTIGLTLARTLRGIEGKSLSLINSEAWIIASNDEHKSYWHSHRHNITDETGESQTDSDYTMSIYLDVPSCGSPYTDLMLAHKDDIYSAPVEKGRLYFFDGTLFHNPLYVPKEFGWRYCAVCDYLFDND